MKKAVPYIYIFITLIIVCVKGEGGCRQLEFLYCDKDKAFTGYVIKTKRIAAPGLENCQHQCFIQRQCVSYNLGPIEDEKRTCELNDADRVEHPDKVKSVPGAKYCSLKNPCSSSPCPNKETCKPDFYFNSFKCIDARSCKGLKYWIKRSGVYSITPIPGYTFQVYCDQETDGGGWTVIQKRIDGLVNFYRGWDDYRRGFGDKNEEHWLGLDAIHILTNSSENELRVDLKDFSLNTAYALYDSFRIGSELEKYVLHVGNLQGGEAGDALRYHNTSKFSTFDKDNDRSTSTNCASLYKGAWWYKSCYTSNLNGLYKTGQQPLYAKGINWQNRYSLKEVEIKIRPVRATHLIRET